MAEELKWGKWTNADAGTIKDIAETASTLAEQIKTTSVLANAAMTTVKWVAELQSVNPFLSALDKLADELLKAIGDIKNAGYYYLIVDPYSPKKNVEAKTELGLGWEVIRDKAGRRLYWNPSAPDPEATTTVSVPPFRSTLFEPKLAYPRKLVAGGHNPLKDNTFDPFTTMSPFPVYNAKKVIKTMAAAFKDKGDVPRYVSASYEDLPETGVVVFNNDGEPVSGWDRSKEFGQQLWDIGKTNIDGSAHTSSDLVGTGWKTQRRQINRRTAVGKPYIEGSTMSFSPMSSKEDVSVTSSAMVFIIGATSYQHFATSFNEFSKLFADLDALQAGVTQSVLDAYKAFTEPEPQVVKLTMCDEQYGLFAEGDVIRGQNYGGLGTITSINSSATSNSSIVSTVSVLQTDDIGNTRRRFVEKDMNAKGRYKDMEVTIMPLPTKESKGIEYFTPNDSVYEQEQRGNWGSGDQKHPNYQVKGVDTMSFISTDTTVQREKNPERARQSYNMRKQTSRVYPKYGTVAMQSLESPPDATPPNFEGIQIGQMIPGWNDAFELIEGYIEQVKGYIATSTEFIQDMIDSLNDLIEFLEDLIKAIQDFLKFFEVDLSSSGIYSLYISDNTGGSSGLASKIQSAEGLPKNLDYAAGILFVGIGSYNDLLGPIFDPKQGWK